MPAKRERLLRQSKAAHGSCNPLNWRLRRLALHEPDIFGCRRASAAPVLKLRVHPCNLIRATRDGWGKRHLIGLKKALCSGDSRGRGILRTAHIASRFENMVSAESGH